MLIVNQVSYMNAVKAEHILLTMADAANMIPGPIAMDEYKVVAKAPVRSERFLESWQL